MGFTVLDIPEVLEALEITNEQKEIIKAIRQDYWKEKRARKIKLIPYSRDKFRTEELKLFAQERSINKKSCEKVFEILTASQIEKFKIIMGKEVDVSKLNEQYVEGLIAEYQL